VSARRPHGFSLVELLVTIAVALLLLVGIARVFITSKQSYRVQESTSRMQENIRIASDYFSRYLRLADFWGGVPAADVTLVGSASYDGPGGCSDDWIVDPAAGLVGYAGGATEPAGLPGGCLADLRYVPGSDLLTLRYANPDSYLDTATLLTPPASPPITRNGRYYLRTKVGQRSLLFDAGDDAVRADVATTALPGTAAEGVMNYQFQAVAFYIQSNDFGRGPVPTLAMLKLETDEMESEPLVDGIEMLGFEYGLDTNDDRQVDSYREAAAIGDWQQVLSVRVAFVARGDELENVVDREQYPLSASRCYGPVGSGCAVTYSDAAARYQRRLVVQEIQLRNRVRA
jgi:type IV pilus assembly protein PilW